MDRAKAINTLIALAVCSVGGLCCGEDCPVKDKCWNEKSGDAWTEDGVIEAVHFLREQETVTNRNGLEWISVKERLPDNKEHDWVLAQVVEDNGYMHIPKVMEYRQNRNDWFEETYGWLSKHKGAFVVTHWMPLPEPPKEGAEG